MKQRALKSTYRQFIDELFLDPERNATRAYMRVYPNVSERSARTAGARVRNDPRVLAEIERREQDLREKAGLSAGEVLQLMVQVATADARDLVEYWRGPCRYCYGEGHKYQRTPQEYRDAWAKYEKLHSRDDPLGLKFDHLGGVGFKRRRDPNPACPECEGVGEGYEYLRDTRTLSPAAARLYAGVKRTKEGIQVLTRSQDKMAELLAKTHGLLREKGEDDENKNAPPAANVTYQGEDCST